MGVSLSWSQLYIHALGKDQFSAWLLIYRMEESAFGSSLVVKTRSHILSSVLGPC